MLLGVKGTIKEGESVPLTLVFERAGTLTISVPVRRGMPAGHHR